MNFDETQAYLNRVIFPDRAPRFGVTNDGVIVDEQHIPAHARSLRTHVEPHTLQEIWPHFAEGAQRAGWMLPAFEHVEFDFHARVGTLARNVFDWLSRQRECEVNAFELPVYVVRLYLDGTKTRFFRADTDTTFGVPLIRSRSVGATVLFNLCWAARTPHLSQA